MKSLLVSLGCLVCLFASSAQAQPAATATAVPTALQDYVARSDDSFAWKLIDKQEAAGARVYDVEFISQTWQDMPW